MSISKNIRVGIIQRVLTPYRRDLFEKLSTESNYNLSVLVGQPLPNEPLETVNDKKLNLFYIANNRYWKGPWGWVCWQDNLVSWLRKFNPQVLVIEANPRILSHWLAICWIRRMKRPILGWGLGELERTGPKIIQGIRRMISYRLIRAMDGMIAYSSKAKRDYVKAGMPEDHVFVAHNSIDNTASEIYLSKYANDISWIQPWRASLGIDRSLPIILFVGRLIASKGIDLLINACKTLSERCELLIVGDGPYISNLRDKSKNLLIHVHFAGHQTGEHLAKLFIGSDIFVLPGAGGLALHQAMSYGKPVIASFGDGTEADLIKDGQNGYIFKLGDEFDLKNKIENILYDPELIRKMGIASLAIIRSEININTMIESYTKAITTTICNYNAHFS